VAVTNGEVAVMTKSSKLADISRGPGTYVEDNRVYVDRAIMAAAGLSILHDLTMTPAGVLKSPQMIMTNLQLCPRPIDLSRSANSILQEHRLGRCYMVDDDIQILAITCTSS
jgi:hypothetical protein